MSINVLNPYQYINDNADQDIREIAANIRRFIETINEFCEGWIGLSYCSHGGTPRTIWAQGNDATMLTQMAIAAARHNVRDNLGIHLNVCPRRGRPAGGRGGDDTISSFPVLWIDVDGKDGKALEQITTFTPSPSIIVETGAQYHYHVYWRLWNPVPYSASVARINQRLAHLFPGADAANSKPSSMIRICGTRNIKPGRDTGDWYPT